MGQLEEEDGDVLLFVVSKTCFRTQYIDYVKRFMDCFPEYNTQIMYFIMIRNVKEGDRDRENT